MARRDWPTANPLVGEALERQALERHHEALRTSRAVVVTSVPPEQGQHLAAASRKTRLRHERDVEIDRTNRMLVERMHEQLARRPVRPASARPASAAPTAAAHPPPGSNLGLRRGEQQRIADENRRLLDRIRSARPEVSDAELRSHARESSRLARQLSATHDRVLTRRQRPASAHRHVVSGGAALGEDDNGGDRAGDGDDGPTTAPADHGEDDPQRDQSDPHPTAATTATATARAHKHRAPRRPRSPMREGVADSVAIYAPGMLIDPRGAIAAILQHQHQATTVRGGPAGASGPRARPHTARSRAPNAMTSAALPRLVVGAAGDDSEALASHREASRSPSRSRSRSQSRSRRRPQSAMPHRTALPTTTSTENSAAGASTAVGPTTSSAAGGSRVSRALQEIDAIIARAQAQARLLSIRPGLLTSLRPLSAASRSHRRGPGGLGPGPAATTAPLSPRGASHGPLTEGHAGADVYDIDHDADEGEDESYLPSQQQVAAMVIGPTRAYGRVEIPTAPRTAAEWGHAFMTHGGSGTAPAENGLAPASPRASATSTGRSVRRRHGGSRGHSRTTTTTTTTNDDDDDDDDHDDDDGAARESKVGDLSARAHQDGDDSKVPDESDRQYAGEPADDDLSAVRDVDDEDEDDHDDDREPHQEGTRRGAPAPARRPRPAVDGGDDVVVGWQGSVRATAHATARQFARAHAVEPTDTRRSASRPDAADIPDGTASSTSPRGQASSTSRRGSGRGAAHGAPRTGTVVPPNPITGSAEPPLSPLAVSLQARGVSPLVTRPSTSSRARMVEPRRQLEQNDAPPAVDFHHVARPEAPVPMTTTTTTTTQLVPSSTGDVLGMNDDSSASDQFRRVDDQDSAVTTDRPLAPLVPDTDPVEKLPPSHLPTELVDVSDVPAHVGDAVTDFADTAAAPADDDAENGDTVEKAEPDDAVQEEVEVANTGDVHAFMTSGWGSARERSEFEADFEREFGSDIDPSREQAASASHSDASAGESAEETTTGAEAAAAVTTRLLPRPPSAPASLAIAASEGVDAPATSATAPLAEEGTAADPFENLEARFGKPRAAEGRNNRPTSARRRPQSATVRGEPTSWVGGQPATAAPAAGDAAATGRTQLAPRGGSVGTGLTDLARAEGGVLDSARSIESSAHASVGVGNLRSPREPPATIEESAAALEATSPGRSITSDDSLSQSLAARNADIAVVAPVNSVHDADDATYSSDENMSTSASPRNTTAVASSVAAAHGEDIAAESQSLVVDETLASEPPSAVTAAPAPSGTAVEDDESLGGFIRDEGGRQGGETNGGAGGYELSDDEAEDDLDRY